MTIQEIKESIERSSGIMLNTLTIIERWERMSKESMEKLNAVLVENAKEEL